MRTIPFALLLLVMACARQSTLPPAPQRLQFELPTAAAGLRGAYVRDVGEALVEVSAFFRAAGYTIAPESLLDSVVVLDWTPEVVARLAQSFGVPPEDIPSTFAGTVAGHTLFVVERERYHAIWTQLYADWRWTDEEYRRLIAHELTHRAHEVIAITRLGSADRMGPPWFFEGLAVMSAGQFDGAQEPLTPAEIDALVGAGRVPPVSYPLYGRLVRSLARRYALQTLIWRAAQAGFPGTLMGARGPR